MPAAVAAALRRRGRPPPRRRPGGRRSTRPPAGSPGVAEYVELRRATSAAYVSYPLIEFATGRPLPDAVYHHPALRRLADLGNDLLSWFNDLASLERDRATAGGHNLVLAMAAERGRAGGGRRWSWWPSAGGRRWRRFMALRAAVPSFGPALDEAVAAHLDGIAYAVRGTVDWSLESARYPAGPDRPGGRPRRGQGRRPSRTTRSSRAKTNSAMPTKPLAVKKARLTWDRSVGRDHQVLVAEGDRGERQPDPPEPAEADQRAEPDEQREGHHVRDGGGVQRERARPYRAGTLCTPISPVDLGVLAGVDQVEAADPQPDRGAEQPGRPGAGEGAGDREPGADRADRLGERRGWRAASW